MEARELKTNSESQINHGQGLQVNKIGHEFAQRQQINLDDCDHNDYSNFGKHQNNNSKEFIENDDESLALT